MGSPERTDDGRPERVVLRVRPHGRALVLPVATLLVLAGTGAYALAAVPPGARQTPVRAAVGVLVTVLLVRFSLLPFLRWRTTSYVVTDYRVVLQRGVLSRTARELSLRWVAEISTRRSLGDRLLGCGTLVLDGAGERGSLVLASVPQVDRVSASLRRLVDRG